MKISWKIDFIRSIKLLLYISIHFLNARSLFLPSPQLIPSNLTASCLCTILVYFLLFNIYRWLLPTKNLVVFYLNINAYIPHMHSRKKKSIRRSENKDQKEMINSKKERKNSKTERKNTPARTYENKNFELQKCSLTCWIWSVHTAWNCYDDPTWRQSQTTIWQFLN